MDNTYSYRMGVTDDYVVIKKEINGIQTSAVYNFDGSMVIDYKYKEICPITKDVFVVTNNGDICAIVDKNGKEIVPFSYNITGFSGESSIYDVYEKAHKTGVIYYTLKDTNGVEKGQYLDIDTKKIIDNMVFFSNSNSLNFSYDKGASGIYYNVSDYYVVLLNSKGEQIGNIKRNKFDINNHIENLDLFLQNNIVPVWKEEDNSHTLAIIK